MTYFDYLNPQILGENTPTILRVALILILVLILQQIIRGVSAKILKILTSREKEEAKEEFEQRIETIAAVFSATVGFVIWIAAALTILDQLGVNVLPLLTGAGILGFAVAFGAQNLVRDMISGLFILLENQYTQGDVIRVAGIEGLVEEVNLRSTVLRDLDGIVHHIPNGEIKFASNLTQKFSRVNLNLLVEAVKDIAATIKAIDKIGRELSEDEKFTGSIKEPIHVLRVEELDKEGVVFKIVGTTRPIKQWEVMGELRKRLKEAFAEENIVVYEKKGQV